MKKLFQNFGGIGLELFNLTANEFYGYGLSLGTVGITTDSKISRALLFVNFKKVHNNEGEKIVICGGLLFAIVLRYTYVIREEKRRCAWCEKLCNQGLYFKGATPYCSDRCRDSGDVEN